MNQRSNEEAPTELPVWHDRLGRRHQELAAAVHEREPRAHRVLGPFESSWRSADHSERPLLAQQRVEQGGLAFYPCDRQGELIWEWISEDADASDVLLWTNPVLDHAHIERHEMTRLEGSDLWTIALQLPADLRCSYGFAPCSDGNPPWRSAQGRRDTLLAAMQNLMPDPLNADSVAGPRAVRRASVAHGPDAPPMFHAAPLPHSTEHPRVTELSGVDAAEMSWVYSPPDCASTTPLLILFDGHVWRHELPNMLDSAIRTNVIDPLHVLFIDAHDLSLRWDRLGVPGGTIDCLLDSLLPAVRSSFPVIPSGAGTIVAGQSLGGLAALWALALSQGQIRHAVAQSPSLWRFDMADALLEDEAWKTIMIQAGTFEGTLLADAISLHERMTRDHRLGSRNLTVETMSGGHDWAVWRAGLLGPVAQAMSAT